MEEILLFILQFFGEAVLEFIIEALFEAGSHAVKSRPRVDNHPVKIAIGYTILGLIIGGVSLLILPDHAIHNPHLRLANLLLTPLTVAFAMVALGKWRAARGQNLVRLDRFTFAFLFALAMATTRYFFAT